MPYLSEDNKDRINGACAVLKTIVHWTWVPALLAIGYSQSNPKPSLIKLSPCFL
ncbi:uncharacterized protein MELLADRAFT_88771 [Melampsora larici-populina 98AG31]|uniref:Uncharacterized protein n=1 Tax=Melampsora larici-populina (strain 98AG31 / pathotype 3-4-7) TaxID=747676 RepID=F4RSX9_MELLP|nr:uncharacterized protein MELLADRAFT_88771 [Melampsora larici-populina 98AG31]EGG04525.1 hypothetical protein MELLADRAFT_88771 [Melampsora larici-populina 98AG31]